MGSCVCVCVCACEGMCTQRVRVYAGVGVPVCVWCCVGSSVLCRLQQATVCCVGSSKLQCAV